MLWQGDWLPKKLKTETHKRKGYLLHSSVSFHSKDCFAAIVMFKTSFIQPLMSSISRSMRDWSLTFNIILYNKDDTFGILGLWVLRLNRLNRRWNYRDLFIKLAQPLLAKEKRYMSQSVGGLFVTILLKGVWQLSCHNSRIRGVNHRQNEDLIVSPTEYWIPKVQGFRYCHCFYIPWMILISES